MNQKAIAVIVTIAMMILAGYMVYAYLKPVEDKNKEPFETDDGITGTWIVDLLITFTDGTKQKVTEMEQKFSLFYEDQEVESITWLLYGQAQLINTTDLYDRCEISLQDIDDTNDFMIKVQGVNSTSNEEIFTRDYSPVNSGQMTNILPLNYSKVELWSQKILLNDLFVEEPVGEYPVTFTPLYGGPRYRGLGDTTGEWEKTESLPSVLCTIIISDGPEEGDGDKEITFDSDVIWS